MNRKQAEHDRTVLPRIQALLAQAGVGGRSPSSCNTTASPRRGGREMDTHCGRAHLGPRGSAAAAGGQPAGHPS